MNLFPYAHAMHPQWQMAAALVLAQLRAQMAGPDYAHQPGLALLYITDHLVEQAQDILHYLQAELPLVTDWVGTVGVGILATNAEYWDEPAIAVMLLDLPADQYRVFSGVAPLGIGFEAHSALVHADSGTLELTALIEEMAARTSAGYVFGGVASSRARSVQFAVAGNGTIRGQGRTSGVFSGGMSGVALSAQVGLVSRVTQGCMPISPVRKITAAERNLVLQIDGRPALEVMLQDLGVSLAEPQKVIDVVRATLVGLLQTQGRPADATPLRRTGNFGDDVVVRHIIGLDPARGGVAVAEQVHSGADLVFCQRNAQAARADLMRICAEIREEIEPQEVPMAPSQWPTATTLTQPEGRILGALYVSCSGRGGQHFGGPSAELQVVRHALGDVPLVGFFAGGEIARNHLYGYTGVLSVFTGV